MNNWESVVLAIAQMVELVAPFLPQPAPVIGQILDSIIKVMGREWVQGRVDAYDAAEATIRAELTVKLGPDPNAK